MSRRGVPSAQSPEPPIPKYFITGGRQRQSSLRTHAEWFAYEKAVLIELNTDTGQARTVLEYASPPGRCPTTQPSFVFKAGAWDGAHLLLCTQTEVIIFDPAAERVVRTISHPWFNDVHHVTRIGGRLHVVSTGLDALLVFDEEDKDIVEVHSATGEDTWTRFDSQVDYRLVPTTKPHRAHPNYAFEADGARWITRFEQRDAYRLDGSSASIRIADDPIHDGVIEGKEAWFTVVSGEVVAVDLARQAVTARYDLDRIGGEGGHPLGWCRGIHHEGDTTLLAFSRLRPTKLKQNLAWLRRPLGKAPEPLPTRVAAYDLRGGRKLNTWVLEDAGIASIFSILPTARS